MSELPNKDDTKTNAEQGLYQKFSVERTDGSSAPGGKHHGCRHFVLDVDHDPAAKAALTAYAAAVAPTHPKLARDIRSQYDLSEPQAQPEPSLIQKAIRQLRDLEPWDRKTYSPELSHTLAQIAQAQPAVSVPGWQLVPTTMHIDMSIAFAEVWYSRPRTIDDDNMQDAWEAALAAAPTPAGGE